MRRKYLQLILLFLVILPLLSGCQNMASSLGTKLTGSNNTPPQDDSGNTTALSYRTGDRFYIASVLNNLFLPQSPGAETALKTTLIGQIDSGVTNQVSDFGGACDNFLGSGAPVPVGQRVGPDCRNTALTQVQSVILPTSIRAALIMKTVYRLLDSNNGEMPLRNIIAITKQIAFTSVVLANVSAPTTDDIRHLFAIIYPGTDPAEDTIQNIYSYSNSISQQFTPKDAWRYTTILMISPMIWQIP